MTRSLISACGLSLWLASCAGETVSAADVAPVGRQPASPPSVVENSTSIDAARLDAIETRLAHLEQLLVGTDLDADFEFKALERLGGFMHTAGGVAALRRFLDRFPEDDRAGWVSHQLVQACLGLGRLDDAIEAVEARERSGDESYTVAFDRGSILLAQRDHQAAVSHFTRVAEDSRWTDYERLEGRFYLGFTLLESGRFDSAAEVFESLIGLYDADLDEHTRLLIEGAQYQLQRAQQWRAGG